MCQYSGIRTTALTTYVWLFWFPIWRPKIGQTPLKGRKNLLKVSGKGLLINYVIIFWTIPDPYPPLCHLVSSFDIPPPTPAALFYFVFPRIPPLASPPKYDINKNAP